MVANKKTALTTQLKTAKSEIESLKSEIESLSAKLKSSDSSKDYYSKQSNEYKSEIDQLHALLDSCLNILPRRNESTYSDHSAMTRLASWFMSSHIK